MRISIASQIVFCLYLFAGTLVNAQNDSTHSVDPLESLRAPRKKGIYKTYEEFRTNSPSISYEGKVEKFGRYTGSVKSEESDFYEYKIKFKDSLPCSNDTTIWGFSDGSNVYKARGAKFKKGMIYDKIIYLGRYAYFKSAGDGTLASNALRPNSFHSNYMGTSIGQTSGGSLKGAKVTEFGMDINTGEVFKLTYSKLKEIFSTDPVLLKKLEEDKKAHMYKGDYLMRYSEKHPEEIK